MKPIGSEKLTGMDKIQRIIEIANYGNASGNVTESTTEYTKHAVDGNTYAIVKEKDGYYVKVGLNESSLDYVDGILNKNKNRFSSYSGALKKINLMIKPLNEEFNEGKEDPVLNETKYVLKKPAAPTPVEEPAPVEEPSMDMPADDEDFDLSSLDLGDDDADMDGDMTPEEPEMGEEPEMDEEPESEEGGDKLKKVQKLTGKLGQALREMKIDLESSDIKYVLNSIISAVDLTKLNEEDLEGVMENFEELDSFEIEGGEPMSDEEEPEMDFDFSDEEMEMDSEEAPEEEMAESDESEEHDYRPMADREDEEDMESELDENAFIKGLASLGGKFVDFYKNNPAAREVINDLGAKAVSKGTDKMADELDKSDKFDKEGKMSSTLKGMNPSKDEIDSLGNMIFGNLAEDEVSQKIDDVLGKYFL